MGTPKKTALSRAAQLPNESTRSLEKTSPKRPETASIWRVLLREKSRRPAGGSEVTFADERFDYVNVLSQVPIKSGVHFVEFLMHMLQVQRATFVGNQKDLVSTVRWWKAGVVPWLNILDSGHDVACSHSGGSQSNCGCFPFKLCLCGTWETQRPV